MPTTAVPVTAIRLDDALKARIEGARVEIARATPGLTPTFSDAVRVLLCEALVARAASPRPARRGGVVLHRATNGASVATPVGNDTTP